jgi:hypothetical protein
MRALGFLAAAVVAAAFPAAAAGRAPTVELRSVLNTAELCAALAP